MTWKNHRLTTFAMAYAVTGGMFFALVAMFSSTLPDRLELWGLIKHRTVTHFWALPLGVAGLLLLTAKQGGGKPSMVLLALVFGYAAHLFQDCLSKGGVPVFGPWGKKVGVGLYVTGNTSESIAVWTLVFLASSFAAGKGYFSAEHIIGQPKEIVIFLKNFLAMLDTVHTLIVRG